MVEPLWLGVNPKRHPLQPVGFSPIDPSTASLTESVIEIALKVSGAPISKIVPANTKQGKIRGKFNKTEVDFRAELSPHWLTFSGVGR